MRDRRVLSTNVHKNSIIGGNLMILAMILSIRINLVILDPRDKHIIIMLYHMSQRPSII